MALPALLCPVQIPTSTTEVKMDPKANWQRGGRELQLSL